MSHCDVSEALIAFSVALQRLLWLLYIHFVGVAELMGVVRIMGVALLSPRIKIGYLMERVSGSLSSLKDGEEKQLSQKLDQYYRESKKQIISV